MRLVNHIYNKYLYTISLFIVAAATILSGTPVSALSIDYNTLKIYATNNIIYYDPSPIDCTATNSAPSGDKITLIGDSIAAGAKDAFLQKFPGIDLTTKSYNEIEYQLVQDGKSFISDLEDNYSGMTVAQALKEQHELRSYLVLAIGTDDPVALTDDIIDQLVESLGEQQNIVLVTSANDGSSDALDYTSNNAVIRAAAERHNNIIIADWAKAISNNPTTYIADSVQHTQLSAGGNTLFVQTIYDALKKSNNGSSTGNNLNYAGDQIFSDEELKVIAANRPFYEQAAAKYGFPWQILAAIHSAEHSLLRTNPENGQGIYQLYSYTAGGTNENAFLPAGAVSDEEFARQTDIVAGIIANYGIDWSTDAGVKKIFFRYNGMASEYINKALTLGFSEAEAKTGEGSPYVMNRFDAQRDPTNSSGVNPIWKGRYVADGEYDTDSYSTRFGTFVKFAALGGSNSLYCGANNLGIVETAILLSWGDKTHAKNDPKPEYVAAMKAVGNYRQGCNGGGCAPEGASCDQFVSTVLRYSGVDPDFPTFGSASQVPHLENSGLYQEIIHNDDWSNIQPGDIFFRRNTVAKTYHILLYIGEIDGKRYQASASFNGRTGEHFAGISFWDGTEHYRVFRKI